MKPIPFNTEMVRAILEGSKRVPWRVVKPQPSPFETNPHKVCENIGNETCFYFDCPGLSGVGPYKIPFRDGDILYVQETWQEVYETEYYADTPDGFINIRNLILNFDDIPKVEAGISSKYSTVAMKPRMKYFVFKASDINYSDTANGLHWRPSIHMPKEAARLFLRVMDVRVERLLTSFFAPGVAIMELRKEGITIPGDCVECIKNYGNPCCIDAEEDSECGILDEVRGEFSDLWDSTIKKADLPVYGWGANPWMWVIEFERISKEAALKGGAE